MVRPTLSLTLPTFGPSVPANQWHRLLDLARAVDDAGIDRVLLTDHVVMGEHLGVRITRVLAMPGESAA